MRATGINLNATNAHMCNANVAPQPQTHYYYYYYYSLQCLSKINTVFNDKKFEIF